jgi:hypothetical protein
MRLRPFPVGSHAADHQARVNALPLEAIDALASLLSATGQPR